MKYFLSALQISYRTDVIFVYIYIYLPRHITDRMIYLSYYLNGVLNFFVASKAKNVETSPVKQTVYSVQVSYTIEWWARGI